MEKTNLSYLNQSFIKHQRLMQEVKQLKEQIDTLFSNEKTTVEEILEIRINIQEEYRNSIQLQEQYEDLKYICLRGEVLF